MAAGSWATMSTGERRDRATKEAFWVALSVLIVAVVLLFAGQVWAHLSGAAGGYTASVTRVETPQSTKTTEKDEIVTGSTPSHTTSKTTERQSGSTIKTTEAPAKDTSFLGRVFANPVSTWVLQALLALLLAFLAGAAWQRFRLGEYGFTMAGLVVPSLPEIPSGETKAVKDEIDEDETHLRGILDLTVYRRPRWWSMPPQADDAVQVLKLQRISLEAALRELALVKQLNPQKPLATLVGELSAPNSPTQTFAVEFGVSILKLTALGDRLIGGAGISDAASVSLRAANDTAIHLLFVLLPADPPPAGG
ncbi:hypothetical protein [Leifsonia sp. NPDC058248]|uniref:hypothetical protein n=1 Tax=Leifsonia sp. NPDC058248 TaxID=3346402 RepID=UPI0036DD2DB6